MTIATPPLGLDMRSPRCSVLVVVAHPDDETFGLGAVIDAMISAGAAVHVLCFTRGEAHPPWPLTLTFLVDPLIRPRAAPLSPEQLG